MPDALTLLRAFAEVIGATLDECPDLIGDGTVPSYVVLRRETRVGTIEIRSTVSPDASFNTVGQAADALAQTLHGWIEACEAPVPVVHVQEGGDA